MLDGDVLFVVHARLFRGQHGDQQDTLVQRVDMLEVMAER
jgi:hypothetical protein